ncbi:MAG: class I SAM-dependent methyltransferase [Elainellaceae cyanobacterium]
MFPNSKQQFFDRWAATYDWLVPSVFYQAIHQRLLEYVHKSDRLQVLDISCGTGQLLDRLASQFPDLEGTGIDFSTEMINQATKRDRYPSRLTYLQGNAEALPFPDAAFDAIFNTISFLHYANPELVFAEVQRVLRSGGYFYLVDFTTRWARAPQTLGTSPQTSIRLYSPTAREQLGQQAKLTAISHHYLLGPVLLTIFQRC